MAFARRPGRFADVIDCRSGAQLARLEPPEGHHFYGHGVFSPEGEVMYTTENAFESGEGMIGVWNARDYRRIGQFPSGGIGPHEMLLRRDAPGLVVANGGIETHPDTGLDVHNYFTHPDYQNVLAYQAKTSGGDYSGESKTSSFYFGSLFESVVTPWVTFGAFGKHFSY